MDILKAARKQRGANNNNRSYKATMTCIFVDKYLTKIPKTFFNLKVKLQSCHQCGNDKDSNPNPWKNGSDLTN